MAIPVILYQVWGFVAPGLYQKEKRIALPLLASSVLLFYAGAAFAYFVVFPLIFAFFTSVGPDSVQVMTDINSYLDFVLKLFLAFGIAFEMPIAAVILIWTGVTSPDALAKKRPYIIVGCFVFGMLLTPPDVISQSLLAIPMWLLFELGVFFGRLEPPERKSWDVPLRMRLRDASSLGSRKSSQETSTLNLFRWPPKNQLRPMLRSFSVLPVIL